MNKTSSLLSLALLFSSPLLAPPATPQRQIRTGIECPNTPRKAGPPLPAPRWLNVSDIADLCLGATAPFKSVCPGFRINKDGLKARLRAHLGNGFWFDSENDAATTKQQRLIKMFVGWIIGAIHEQFKKHNPNWDHNVLTLIFLGKCIFLHDTKYGIAPTPLIFVLSELDTACLHACLGGPGQMPSDPGQLGMYFSTLLGRPLKSDPYAVVQRILAGRAIRPIPLIL